MQGVGLAPKLPSEPRNHRNRAGDFEQDREVVYDERIEV